jgi:uncharacterized delta-60 repeat protein
MTARTTNRRRPALEALEGRALLSAGTLDATFGGTGTVVTQATTVTAPQDQTQYGSGVAVQADLKTVVAGVSPETYNKSTHLDIVVVRYNTDGGLDTTFGSGGVVRIRSTSDYWDSSSEPHLTSVALRPDGKIVVAGVTKVTYGSGKNAVARFDLYLARLNPNGSFDTTFNGTGSKTLDFPQGSVYAEGVALQPDGKIVVGADSGAAGLHFLAARFNADGGLDHSFGPNGQGYVGRASGGAQAMTLDGAGAILLGGGDTDPTTGGGTAAVVRYTPAGLPDPTFGSDGEALVRVGAPFVEGIGVQSTGRVIASGDFGSGARAVRLNADGSVDTTFGTGGLFYDATMFHPQAVAVQPDDAVLIAGKGPSSGSTYGYFVDRLLAGGTADPSFGTDGQAQAYFSGMTGAQANALALGPDGKITVTGEVDSSQGGVYRKEIGTARFLNDLTGNPPPAASTTASTRAPAFVPTLVPLALDGPDLWDAFLPPLKRRGAR